MQAYFDRDDANLEAEALLTQSTSDRDAGDEVADFGRRRYLNLLGFTVALGLIAVFLAVHLGSIEPALSYQEPKFEKPEVRFEIEIPEPEVEQPKPKPKPKVEPPKPEPEKVERLRSVPDQKIQKIRQNEKLDERREVRETDRDVETEVVKNRVNDKIRERNEVRDNERDVKTESTSERSLPAVRTPKIVAQETVADRDVSHESIRQSTVSGLAKTTGDFVDEIAPQVNRGGLPEEGLSRIKLDPYTYQMVNVCLRLCAQSMFTHTGMSGEAQEGSSRWLKVSRGSGGNSFSYRFNERWVNVTVNVNSLTDISNLNFISIPSDLSGSGKADQFLKEVTRKLCTLLGYDDCVQRL